MNTVVVFYCARCARATSFTCVILRHRGYRAITLFCVVVVWCHEPSSHLDILPTRQASVYYCVHMPSFISPITLSSSEAKYMALKEAIKEQQYIKAILKEISAIYIPISIES